MNWFRILIHKKIVKEILDEIEIKKSIVASEANDFIRHRTKGRNQIIDELEEVKNKIREKWKIK